MTLFQFKWQPKVCNATTCETAFAASAETVDEAAMFVIKQHFDPTLILDWQVEGGNVSSSLGKLTVNNAIFNVTDYLSLSPKMSAQLAEALPETLEAVVNVEDTTVFHWPTEEELAEVLPKPKVQKPKKFAGHSGE
jgi:hypothetical protein